MEENINMTNIIVLGLVYNYLSNGKSFLTEKEMMNFFDKINSELSLQYQNEISGDIDEDDFLAYHYDYKEKVFKLEEVYSLEGLYFYYIEDISEHIIKISLKDEVLRSINVKREHLKTKIKTIHVSEKKDIYSLRMSDAQNSARNILEQAGYKNIQIGFAIPDQLQGDKGYHVPVSYDKNVICLDVKESEKSLLKRQSIQQKKD